MSSGETVKQWVREVTTTDEGLVNLLIRLQTSVFSSHRGAYRRIARDRVSPFFDDWPAVEEKLKVMLSGNELTPSRKRSKQRWKMTTDQKLRPLSGLFLTK